MWSFWPLTANPAPRSVISRSPFSAFSGADINASGRVAALSKRALERNRLSGLCGDRVQSHSWDLAGRLASWLTDTREITFSDCRGVRWAGNCTSAT